MRRGTKKPETPPSRLRDLRIERGWSQQDLATRADCPQSDIAKLETGKKKMTVNWMVKLGNALGVEPKELIPSVRQPFVKHNAPKDVFILPDTTQPVQHVGGIISRRDLPIRGVANGGEGRVFMMPEEQAPVDWAPRPPILEGVPDAYGLFVFEDSMHPMFKHGHTLWVHPHMPARPGDGIVIVLKSGEILVKELVRKTGAVYRLKRYRPTEEEYEIPASDVRYSHTVVGSFTR